MAGLAGRWELARQVYTNTEAPAATITPQHIAALRLRYGIENEGG